MTDARVERIEPDPWLAAGYLDRARGFASDGLKHASIGPESRRVLLHSAVIAACDAVLAVNGRAVRGADGGHRKRLDEARGSWAAITHLPDWHADG